MAQAGYPNGVDVELQTPVGRYTLDKQLTEAMIPMLNAAGFRARLLTPEWATLWASVQKGTIPFYYMGRGSVQDPSAALHQYFHTGETPRIGYSNPKLDELLDKEQQEFDPKRRREYLSQAMSILTEDAPACFMWRHKLLWVAQPRRLQAAAGRAHLRHRHAGETLMLRLDNGVMEYWSDGVMVRPQHSTTPVNPCDD